MRDIGVLKERIELAERNLTAAQSARERESDALMQMWKEIKGRFDKQERDIARFRSDVSRLTDANEELSRLVEQLVTNIEGTVEHSRDETVPQISRLATELLSSEPKLQAAPEPAPPARETAEAAEADDDGPDLDALVSDDPLDLGEPIVETTDFSFEDMLETELSSDEEETDGKPGATLKKTDGAHSTSAGIRNLISRIEGAVGSREAAGNPAAAVDRDAEADDDLARELKEIESLRSELNGLRKKISGK